MVFSSFRKLREKANKRIKSLGKRVKLSLCLTKYHTMKAYWGVEVPESTISLVQIKIGLVIFRNRLYICCGIRSDEHGSCQSRTL
jgi:hypothetical protein